jgi:SAM-dependent methyltransferase
MLQPELLKQVADYYSTTVSTHGATAAGADWKDENGQILRFKKLLDVVKSRENYSIDDYGCGYGALFDHLSRDTRGPFDYLGLDVSEAMIATAAQAHPEHTDRFKVGSVSPRTADFALASGIFNVKIGYSYDDWEHYIIQTLDLMNAHCTSGLAFNCLSSYSDPHLHKAHLYYADPRYFFDICKRKYSKQVSLLHDYPLYEFTIIVRKDERE